MRLVQKSKSAKNIIPLDAERALQPTAFATYTTQVGDAAPTHVALGWTLVSVQKGEDGKRAKYQDNVFELHVDARHVDALLEALQVAKARFAVAEVPK